MSSDGSSPAAALPATVRFLERDWLSCNQVLFDDGDGSATVVDTGYLKHADVTAALLRHALGGRRLARIVNTHLHSDHCGGNARLFAEHGCTIVVPAADRAAVDTWDERALTYSMTGQRCARFTAHASLADGDRITMGGFEWQALAAPGHDPHSLVLWCAGLRTLVSADVLWRDGFGVIFPELGGESGFAEQQAILERIASLPVARVLPGHGPAFDDVGAALERAFSRLAALRADPRRNARNALKVLVKFALLDRERLEPQQLLAIASGAQALENAAGLLGLDLPTAIAWATDALVAQGELRREGGLVVNA